MAPANKASSFDNPKADYLKISWVPGSGELTILCTALLGGSLAFLWYNAHPAEVFMGDTGSLAIGALTWWAVADSVPNWWSNILPYVVVLLVLVFFAQRLRMPAAEGIPYRRGES